MEHFDFLVIGGGIAGASVAYELRNAGRVALLEREEQCGYHATGRSAALFVRCYGNGLVQKLTEASSAFLSCPPDGFIDGPLLLPRGCLYIASRDQGGALDKFYADHSDLSVELIDGDAVNRLAPGLRSGYAVGGVFEAKACSLDVHGLVTGYLRASRRAGVRVYSASEVRGIEHTDNGYEIEVNGQNYSTRVLINAAGAWADQIAVMAGVEPLGLRPLRRTAILVDPPLNVMIAHWPMVVTIDEQFFFKPEGGKLMMSPCDETLSVPCDAQPEELDIAICVDRIEKATNFEIKRISHSWAGLRTFTPDRSPAVGYAGSDKNFVWVAGQGGFGIQAAPAIAKIAAALALREGIPPEIQDYGLNVSDVSPARFGPK